MSLRLSFSGTIGGLRGGSSAFQAGLWYSICTTLALPQSIGRFQGGYWWCAFLAPVGLVWLFGRSNGLGNPTGRVRRDALMAALGALPFWGVNQAWMWEVSEWGCIPACLLQASYTGVLVAFVLVIRRSLEHRTTSLQNVQDADSARPKRSAGIPLALLAPIVWVGVEYLRGEIVFNGYAWALAGQPIIDSPFKSLVGLGAALGAYAVSLAVVLPAAILIDWIKGRKWAAALGALALVLFWFVFGEWGRESIRQNAPGAVRVSVGVVQTNVPQNNKVGWTPETELEDWKRIVPLVMKASETDDRGERPDFVLWPETMMPGMTIEPEAVEVLRHAGLCFRIKQSDGTEKRLDATLYFDELMEVSRRVQVPMLIGEEAIDGLRVSQEGNAVRFSQDARFNSVFLVAGGEVFRSSGDAGAALRYDKIHLTPFGETMPGISRWKWLEQRMLDFGGRGLKFDLGVGKNLTRFEIPIRSAANTPRTNVVRVVTPICFEVTDSDLCRRLVYDGSDRKADLIASVTNDGWFAGSDAARRQHLQIARWRCVELGVPMVRAANTGISAIVQSDGNLRTEQPARLEGVLRGAVEFGNQSTRYSRIAASCGNVIGWLSLTVTGCLFGISAWIARNRLKGAIKGVTAVHPT